MHPKITCLTNTLESSCARPAAVQCGFPSSSKIHLCSLIVCYDPLSPLSPSPLPLSFFLLDNAFDLYIATRRRVAMHSKGTLESRRSVLLLLSRQQYPLGLLGHSQSPVAPWEFERGGKQADFRWSVRNFRHCWSHRHLCLPPFSIALRARGPLP